MADTRLGKIGITVKEPWAADISYEVLDVTLYAVEDGGDGCSYTALRDNIGVTPGTDPNTWVKSTQAGQSIYDLAVKYHHFVGTEEEFEAQYQAVLQAARDAAAGASAVEAQVEAAEALRVSAEASRVSAESARQSAEASRASAESARGTAEAARQSAESGRASAETARVTAEQGRASAESERASAEAARAAAETDRVSDFSALKTDMETAIGQADAATAAAVATNNQIQTAEAGRVSAEQGRVSAETARASAESARATAETSRATAETARVTAEGQRATAEGQRVTAENARVSAESDRDTAEQGRVSAEAARVSAETARESQASSDHTTAVADHAIVQGYDTRLTNVEGEVSQLGQEVGHESKTIIYGSENYCGYYYSTSSNKVVASGATANGVLLPVEPGVKYSFSGTPSSGSPVSLWTGVPTIGSNDGLSRTIPAHAGGAFIAQPGEKYVLFNVIFATSTTISVTAITGLFNQVTKSQETAEVALGGVDTHNYTSSDYCGFYYSNSAGEVKSSASTVNGVFIRLMKGVEYRFDSLQDRVTLWSDCPPRGTADGLKRTLDQYATSFVAGENENYALFTLVFARATSVTVESGSPTTLKVEDIYDCITEENNAW